MKSFKPLETLSKFFNLLCVSKELSEDVNGVMFIILHDSLETACFEIIQGVEESGSNDKRTINNDIAINRLVLNEKRRNIINEELLEMHDLCKEHDIFFFTSLVENEKEQSVQVKIEMNTDLSYKSDNHPNYVDNAQKAPKS